MSLVQSRATTILGRTVQALGHSSYLSCQPPDSLAVGKIHGGGSMTLEIALVTRNFSRPLREMYLCFGLVPLITYHCVLFLSFLVVLPDLNRYSSHAF